MTGKLCKEPGCTEPVHTYTGKPKTCTLCTEHLRAYNNQYRRELVKQRAARTAEADTAAARPVTNNRLLLIDPVRNELLLMEVVQTRQVSLDELSTGGSFERLIDVYARLGYRLVERRAPKPKAEVV
jgi:hypothetical protein